MSTDIGFDAETPSLPAGGGAVSGLGQTFTPDLSTGSGSFAIPLDAPNGPGDIGPRLHLRYDTGQGNGPYGLGIALSLPRLLRSTAHGFPRYGDEDTLLLEGAGELVRTADGFRPQVDGGAWRASVNGAGFECMDREGNQYLLGSTADAQLSDGGRVFAWHLEQVQDALGNTARFTWTRDGRQLYLATVSYGTYELVFDYEPRPDVIRDGRAGFLVTTSLRCRQVTLRMPADAQPVLRTWTFGYTQHPHNGASLLSTAVLAGHAPDATVVTAPPLTLTYSTVGAPTLTRFAGQEPVPPSFGDPGARVDLVDWNGNGLPDMVQLAPAGTIRVWPNLGGCRWGPPQTVARAPALARAAAVALIDLDGDGLADLVRTDQPVGEYVPRVLSDLGFAEPVTFRQAPSPVPADPSVRLVDLDGDGAADLLTSDGTSLALYYQGDGGWQPVPQVVGRGEAPVTNLADPHVFIADMTGDGLADIVRVDGAGVTYWPYLGMGRWAPPVQMADPPELGYDADPTRVFVVDVDGDGCADVVQLDGDVARLWINRTGNGFAPPQEIRAVPTGRMASVRVADMTGSGAAGLLWTMASRPGEPVYFFLDLTGGNQAYVLTGIDNGVGLRTTIGYSTSAREAARAAAAGRPWLTRLPVVLPVVTRIDQADVATGVVTSQTFRYADGRWDGALREFAGFGTVTQTQLGDATCPDLQTVTGFAIGLDPATWAEPRTMSDRLTWRAIRGRMLERARYGPDGTAQASFPFDISTWQWDVVVDGLSYLPRLKGQVDTTYERTAAPVSSITTLNTEFDSEGNVTRTVQTSDNPADASQNQQLTTATSFATDPTGRFAAKAARVTQTDIAGTVVADTVTAYDGGPEGTVGAHGLITARSALALTDAQATAVYGAELPDFTALGYHRRDGEDGWWVTLSTYTRTDGPAGLSGTATGPMGGTSSFVFDANRTFPATITDAMGNTIQVVHDYRVNRVSSLTEASGAVYAAAFDPLSRMTAAVEPGDTAALPTRSFEYDPTTVPVTTSIHQRAVSGQPATIDVRERYDGNGRLLERRVRDEAGEVVLESHTYCARGYLAATSQPGRAAADAYALPGPAVPHTAFAYDAIGRPVRVTHPDGSVETTVYGPLLRTEFDAEDNNAGGQHANTPTRKHLDPSGRIVRIEQDLGGRPIASTYSYDTKGELTSHTDALGNRVDFQRDRLGRPVLVDRPEKASRSVFDAAGNPVQARSATATLLVRTFDLLNRPVSVRLGSQAAAEVQYTYHDAGSPTPADAGLHTSGGRLVRIDDAGGSTVIDYDERGRAVHKACTPAGGAVTYLLDSTFRVDGQLASITYPQQDGQRLTLTYDYDRRGQVVAVPGVVRSFDHDLRGRRTATHFSNGTVHSYTYDALTDRLATMRLTAPGAGAVRDLTYGNDLVGNLLSIGSPDPAQSRTHTFDDLYRLLTATGSDGTSWEYAYNDAGAITHKSDVGDYLYGQHGAPAVCVTAAGAATFTYTPHGEVATGPWGTNVFDELGRLVSVTGGPDETFRYDHAGFRVSQTGGGHTRLTPDPLFAVEDGQLVLHLFDGVGIAGRRAADGHTLYLHPDHLGSLSAVTDDAGAVVDTLRYDPFGALLARTGAGAAQPQGYVGGAPDPATGLLYLSARWYSPEYGIFLSPDLVVQNAYDPLSWASYAYCRNNPVSYSDPSGRSFWGIFLACLAIVALIVVTIVSFGSLSAISAVGIGVIVAGMVAGGIVGGLAAAKKGGNLEDIIEGVLVGAAVGGWAGFATVVGGGAGAGVAGLAHLGGFWGAVVAGAVNGAIAGAAMGFATGYAGGKGTLDDVLNNMWQGAVIGLVAGAVLGGVGYLIKPPTGTVIDAARGSLNPPTPAQPPAGGLPATPATSPLTPPPVINDFGQAAGYVGQQTATKAVGAVAGYGFQWVMSSTIAPVATELMVDGAAGGWDLYGMKLLYAIGVVKSPTIHW